MASKKKAAKKKATKKKAAKKKVARKPVISSAALADLEKKRPEILVTAGPNGKWTAVPRSKPRIRGQQLVWFNQDTQDLSIVFDTGKWPFTEPEQVISLPARGISAWFTVDVNTPKSRRGYKITPRGQETVSPGVPPGPSVTPTDP